MDSFVNKVIFGMVFKILLIIYFRGIKSKTLIKEFAFAISTQSIDDSLAQLLWTQDRTNLGLRGTEFIASR